jgi:hypothetical protein
MKQQVRSTRIGHVNSIRQERAECFPQLAEKAIESVPVSWVSTPKSLRSGPDAETDLSIPLAPRDIRTNMWVLVVSTFGYSYGERLIWSRLIDEPVFEQSHR